MGSRNLPPYKILLLVLKRAEAHALEFSIPCDVRGPEENYYFSPHFAPLLPEGSNGPYGDISEHLKLNYPSGNVPTISACSNPMRSSIFPANNVLMPPLPPCCSLWVSDGYKPNSKTGRLGLELCVVLSSEEVQSQGPISKTGGF